MSVRKFLLMFSLVTLIMSLGAPNAFAVSGNDYADNRDNTGEGHPWGGSDGPTGEDGTSTGGGATDDGSSGSVYIFGKAGAFYSLWQMVTGDTGFLRFFFLDGSKTGARGGNITSGQVGDGSISTTSQNYTGGKAGS
ncbi:MAG: hypothetical protein IIB00_01290 [candidate division Zixibacteria bacterium]|nr:hypothetical protein [candidate division Zixibacteria bacterium]